MAGVRGIVFFLALLLLTTGVGAQTVRVAAAANLRYTLGNIKAAYLQKHPHVTIDVTIGSSGSLVQQILNGAQFNLFMAADRIFPEKLKKEGAVTGDVRTYAVGKLILWSNSINVSKGIQIVGDESVHRIAVAKPDVAPYGDRAIQCLEFYNLLGKAGKKIIYADNISQVAQYVSTGNAEVGFLALALALGPDMKNKGEFYLLDSTSYQPIEQACVLVKTRERNPEASRFMDFILSPECTPLFEKYGYRVPSPAIQGKE